MVRMNILKEIQQDIEEQSMLDKYDEALENGEMEAWEAAFMHGYDEAA
jgi:hypothetical protein